MARLVIAITGGVASGKSIATRYFETLGIAVADADVVARDMVEPGQPALAAIVEHFGRGMLGADGHLQRALLRERIFADPEGKRALETIMHPRIRAALRQQCAAAGGPYVVAAIPLLAEVGARSAYPWLDRVMVLDVPRALQFSRLLRRDGITAELATRMIDAQASRENRLAIADDVVTNDGSTEALAAAVGRLDARYRNPAT